MRRYAGAGRLYDLVSLEWLLYRRPRRRLFQLLGPVNAAVAVDVGTGTGLNLPYLERVIGPAGRVIGVDASASMVAAADRRIARAGWQGVEAVVGDASTDAIDDFVLDGHADLVVATFLLSLLADDGPLWAAIDARAEHRPVTVALADLGRPDGAPAPVQPLLAALVRLGGGDPDRRAWERLLQRAPDAVHEIWYGGHVHLAVGTVG